MKGLLTILLMISLMLPATAEEPETPVFPECWVVSHRCLTDFLQAWSDGIDEHAMLALCAPSWKARQADPELALFLLVRNREAKAWRIGQPVADADDRLYDVAVLVDDGGMKPQWYRFDFRLVLEDGVRYVDPDGMKTGETTEEPETYILPEASRKEQSESWWHEAGAWNHAGDPALWAEHNAESRKPGHTYDVARIRQSNKISVKYYH